MTIINVQIFDPKNSSYTRRDDLSSCRIYHCSNSECSFLKNKQCSLINHIFMKDCPYGQIFQEKGFSKRTKKYDHWIEEKKEQYKDALNSIQGSPPNKLAIIGDYVYFPYYKLSIQKFYKISDFDEVFVESILRTHTDEIIPLFILHLNEVMPEIYKKLKLEYQKLCKKNNVGRKALLHTISPCTIEFNKEILTWDGEKLYGNLNSCVNIQLYDQNKRPATKEIEISIIPKKDAVVVISNEDQVNPQTIFIN